MKQRRPPQVAPTPDQVRQPTPASPTGQLPPTQEGQLSPKMASFIASLRDSIAGAPTAPGQGQNRATTSAPESYSPTGLQPGTQPGPPAISAFPPAQQSPVQPAMATSSEAPAQKNVDTMATQESPALPKAARPSSLNDEIEAARQMEAQLAKMASFVSNLEQAQSAPPEGLSGEWHALDQSRDHSRDQFEAKEQVNPPPRKTGQELAPVDDIEPVPPTVKKEKKHHLTLQDMAAMDPTVIPMPTSSVAQDSIRRLKRKETQGLRFELYLIVWVICLVLSFCTQKFAGGAGLREGGIRIVSAIKALTPPQLFTTYFQELKNTEPKMVARDAKHQAVAKSGPSSITSAVAAAVVTIISVPMSAFDNCGPSPVTPVIIFFLYLALLSFGSILYFKFIKRADRFSWLDLVVAPICVIFACSLLSIPAEALLSFSEVIFANFAPDTIITFTAVAMTVAAFDIARQSFFSRHS